MLRADYHIKPGSAALNAGTTGATVPSTDFDGQTRVAPIDIGADEYIAPPPPKPTLTLLDNFDRANATTLGANWNQVTGAAAGSRIDPDQREPGVRSNPWPSELEWRFGADVRRQAGSGVHVRPVRRLAGGSLNGSSLLIKVSNGGGSAANPANYIRVQFQTTNGGRVLVQTTTNGNTFTPNYTTIGTLASGLFATGDTLTAVANADGSVDVWKTTAANVTTYVGRSGRPRFTGTGRIGIQLPGNARVDTFSGGTVP